MLDGANIATPRAHASCAQASLANGQHPQRSQLRVPRLDAPGRGLVASIDADQGCAYGRVGPVHAAAVMLAVAAGDQYRRWRKTRSAHARADWGMPAWQGYGCVGVGGLFVTLAAGTWFLTELKSITLILTFVCFGALSATLGLAVVRSARTPSITR